MDIQQLLQALPNTALIALVEDVYGRYGDIDGIIESYLDSVVVQGEAEVGVTAPLMQWLKRQIEQLLDNEEFVDYRQALQLSSQLERLLSDISSLAELNAVEALAMLDELLARHEEIMERVDDSGGSIGEALSNAMSLWLEVAAELRRQQPQARDWVQTVLDYHEASDYGCFDDVIRDSACLLSEEELRQLAGHFESDIRSALKATVDDGHNRQASHAALKLRSVAEALSDIFLYEQSTLLISPRPNTLQLAGITQYALAIGALERAEYWLQQPQWQDDEHRFAGLNNQLLKRQGNISQLKDNLLESWQRMPNKRNLQAYWEYADDAERQAVTIQVQEQAGSLDRHVDAIEMLLFIGDAKLAADHLIAHRFELGSEWYGTLLGWIEGFDAGRQTLAVIVCYRLLLMDLLERGNARAYHHGARYFHTLLALDKKLPDYRGLDSAQAFITSLQAKHGRKRSFWSAADYPNKAEA